MKKTLSVNIGGMVFNIDEDAFALLQNYLDQMERKFGKSDEGKEIIHDIELRIAEILNEKLSGRKEVVSLADIESLVEILGKPEDIAGEEPATDTDRSSGQKRLYRNPDDKVLAGVLSGIAAYLSIDPVIARVVFVLILLLSAGTATIIYVILWMVMPEALTVAQKLEMKGEKVTVENIEKTIKREFKGAVDNIKNMSKSEKVKDFGSGVEGAFRSLGDSFRNFFEGLKPLFGFIFLFFGVIFLLSAVSAFFFNFSFHFWPHVNFHFFNYWHDLPYLSQPLYSVILTVSLMVVIGIPVIGLIYGGIKLLFGFRPEDKIIRISLMMIWVIAVAVLIVSFANSRLIDQFVY